MDESSVSQDETRYPEDASKIKSELLSQDEIEALLSVVCQEKAGDKKNNIISTSEIHNGTHILPRRRSNRKDVNITEHNLTESSHLSKDSITALRALHNRYAEKLSSSFSGILSADFKAECIHIEQLTYQEYLSSLMDPSCIGVFKIKPSDSIGAIEMSSTCVFSIIDRLLGGQGLSKPYNRPLTNIEETIIIRLIEKALKALRDLWQQNANVEMKLERLEKNPRLAQIAPAETLMVLIVFGIRLSVVCGMMSLCLPYEFVKEAFENVKKRKFSGPVKNENVKPFEKGVQEHILNIRVNVSARYDSGSVTLGEFMELQKGDIVKLQRADKDKVVIFIEGKGKLLGKPGVIDGQRAVQICEIL